MSCIGNIKQTGSFIVIDVSLRSSLEGVDKWLDFVRESRGQDAMIFLVGNKSDIAEREVSKKEL